MFTGLIEDIGIIKQRSGKTLVISPSAGLENPQYGESIAINGCCLTLEKCDADGNLVFHTLAETLSRTNLAHLPVGSRVNLERAMQSGARFGGHLVQGHVDTTAAVLDYAEQPNGDVEMVIALPPQLAPEIISKGSIAIDGVSLTVSRRAKDRFTVCLIPETRKRTALADRRGSEVNLESDIIGKYVRHILDPEAEESARPITMERLAEAGFL